jgi:hypothetical protein
MKTIATPNAADIFNPSISSLLNISKNMTEALTPEFKCTLGSDFTSLSTSVNLCYYAYAGK